MPQKEDRRVRRTKQILKKTLLELLQEKELSKITISELADRADINRGTFYAHYSDVSDLFLQMETEFLDDVLKIVTPIFENPDNSQLIFESLLLHMKERQDILCAILNRPNSLFLLALTKRLESELQPLEHTLIPSPTISSTYYYSYLAGGLLSIIKDWQQTGMQTSISEFASLMCELIFFTLPGLRRSY